jgi:hypothetical protein
MAMTVREDTTTCARCGEALRAAEPCACVRGRPAPLTETPLQACADSQHYACPGYGMEEAPGVSVWLRCCCTCHSAALDDAA